MFSPPHPPIPTMLATTVIGVLIRLNVLGFGFQLISDAVSVPTFPVMGSVAKNGLNNYVKQLQEHPLRTKSITAGVLSGISDIVSQKLTGTQKLQFKRLFLKVFLGAAYFGPFGHYFQLILEKIFKGKKDSKTVAKKKEHGHRRIQMLMESMEI